VSGNLRGPSAQSIKYQAICTAIGEDLLITGAGPIGIMAAAVARHVGRDMW
jgi:threonine dehydrogenase-like Zn-dependent dehydrogenase